MPTLNWIGKEKVVNHHLDVPSALWRSSTPMPPRGKMMAAT